MSTNATSGTVPVQNVHSVEYGGPADGPRVVLVHGLGGSHANWSALGPLLAESTRPVALDLAGFGRTPGTGRQAYVSANARLVADFLRGQGEPVFLVGNSMGGAVSVLAAAAHPASVRGVVLMDPVLPIPRGVRMDPLIRKQFVGLSIPGVGPKVLAQRLATITPRRRVEATLALCCSDVARMTPEQVDAEVAMAELRSTAVGGVSAHVHATRSVLGLALGPRYRRRLAELRAPVLLLHGVHDRLVPVGAADAVAKRFPSWTYHRMDCGHCPHMELPAESAEMITAWMAGL